MEKVITVRPDGSKRVQHVNTAPSLTRQEFRDECDLAKTIARFVRTPEGRDALQKAKGTMGGSFEDVSSIPDLQTAQNLINRGKAAFEAFPAVLRKRFDNDAAKFLDFCHDPQNLDELRKMGLAKLPVQDPVKGADAPKTPAG